MPLVPTMISGLPTPARWLLLNTLISAFSRGLALPFTVIYLHEVRGLSLSTSGALISVAAGSAMAVTPWVGTLIDRFGARVVWMGLCGLGCVGAVLLALSSTVAPLFGGLALLGVAHGGAWPTINTFIAAVTTGNDRANLLGLNFAFLNLSIGIAGAIGGLILSVDRPGTFVAIYLLDAVFALIPIAFLLGPLRSVHTHRIEHDPPPTVTYLQLLRMRVPLLLCVLGMVIAFVGYGQMEAGLTAFARLVAQVDIRVLGWTFAANALVIVLAQVIVLKLIEGHRRTRAMLVYLGLWALSWSILGATALVPGTVLAAAGVLAMGAIFGLGETLVHPTMPAIINDIAPPSQRGRYNAITGTAFQLGATIAPLSSGWILGAGASALFIGVILVGLAVSAVGTLLLERWIPVEANGAPAPAAR